MRFTWPPSEQNGWTLQTSKSNEKEFFLPMMPQNHLLLAFRIQCEEPLENLEAILINEKAFLIPTEKASWIQFPYPIEFHALGSFWRNLRIPSSNYSIELAYYPWKTRIYRMRAFIDSEGTLLAAYRINKNGQTVPYFPPKNDTMRLPEDTYMFPPTAEINTKSILLVPSQTSIYIKKLTEGRYILI